MSMDKTIDALAQLHALTKGNPKAQKAIAIAQSVVDAVLAMQNVAPKAFPPKRIFRKKDRTPSKRITKQRAKASMFMMPMMARAEVMKIMATPTYPEGGRNSFAVVGETGPEVVIMPRRFAPEPQPAPDHR